MRITDQYLKAIIQEELAQMREGADEEVVMDEERPWLTQDEADEARDIEAIQGRPARDRRRHAGSDDLAQMGARDSIRKAALAAGEDPDAWDPGKGGNAVEVWSKMQQAKSVSAIERQKAYKDAQPEVMGPYGVPKGVIFPNFPETDKDPVKIAAQQRATQIQNRRAGRPEAGKLGTQQTQDTYKYELPYLSQNREEGYAEPSDVEVPDYKELIKQTPDKQQQQESKQHLKSLVLQELAQMREQDEGAGLTPGVPRRNRVVGSGRPLARRGATGAGGDDRMTPQRSIEDLMLIGSDPEQNRGAGYARGDLADLRSRQELESQFGEKVGAHQGATERLNKLYKDAQFGGQQPASDPSRSIDDYLDSLEESKQHLKALVLQELEQTLAERGAPGAWSKVAASKSLMPTTTRRKRSQPDPAPPVTLGGGAETMTTNLPGDVVMTRDPGESARFEVGGDDPFGEDEPVVDAAYAEDIQAWLDPYTREEEGWRDHPNYENLGWAYDQQMAANRADAAEAEAKYYGKEFGRDDDRFRMWPRGVPDWTSTVGDPDSREFVASDIGKDLVRGAYGHLAPRWWNRKESKQHLKGLVLREIEQMRLKEAHGGRLPPYAGGLVGDGGPEAFEVPVGSPVTGRPEGPGRAGFDMSDPKWTYPSTSQVIARLPDDVYRYTDEEGGVRFAVGGDDPFGEEEDVGADWWAEPSEHDWNVLDQSVGEDIFDPELDPVNPRVRARRYGTARPWGADRSTGPGDRGADVSDFGRVNENKELARWTKLSGIK